MGLDDLVEEKAGGHTVTERIERLHEPELCPSCGEVGEETGHYYWRCSSPQDECDVTTYIPNTYESDQ